jgi:hypothetical protein
LNIFRKWKNKSNVTGPNPWPWPNGTAPTACSHSARGPLLSQGSSPCAQQLAARWNSGDVACMRPNGHNQARLAVARAEALDALLRRPNGMRGSGGAVSCAVKGGAPRGKSMARMVRRHEAHLRGVGWWCGHGSALRRRRNDGDLCRGKAWHE